MRLFEPLYLWTLKWSKHRHAPRYLVALSVAESSFFPIPPDVMLAPMVLAKREKAWYYAFITTIASVVGGIIGYLIGSLLFDGIEPLISRAGLMDSFIVAQNMFDEWGFWIIFVAGFSPIPYKVFTLAAGVMSIAILPFIAASIIGRGARFFLVSAIMYWGGEKMDVLLRKHIELMGWAVVIIVVAVILMRI